VECKYDGGEFEITKKHKEDLENKFGVIVSLPSRDKSTQSKEIGKK